MYLVCIYICKQGRLKLLLIEGEDFTSLQEHITYNYNYLANQDAFTL